MQIESISFKASKRWLIQMNYLFCAKIEYFFFYTFIFFEIIKRWQFSSILIEELRSHNMVCWLDFVFDNILLHYYIITILYNYTCFYSRRRITIGFGTATIYKCSAATECIRRVFHALKTYLVFVDQLKNLCIKVAKRKPKYNLGMLYALVRLRLVSRVFVWFI